MLVDQRREGRVEEEHPVFGVIDDVNQLLEMQARIAGVHHHAAAGHRVVDLHVAMIVPGERCRPQRPPASPRSAQRVRELPDARGAIAKV